MQNFIPNSNKGLSCPIGGNQAPQGIQVNVWDLFLAKLRLCLSPTEYETWISPISVAHTDNNRLILTLPNVVFYYSFIEQFATQLEQIKVALNLQSLDIRYDIYSDKNAITPPYSKETSGSLETDLIQEQLSDLGYEERISLSEVSPEEETASAHVSVFHSSQQLNPAYTFETFVKGESNQFAHASCATVAGSPGSAYNPLFIYGSTGLGKTHLLHAVGCKILQNNPNAVITYISSERFTNEMITCMRFNKMWEFRKKYRTCDVFLVDDIQFISRKGKTQEEFFHTFNALYENQKQIVITSDLFPQDIPDIEERLRNRFQWGLIADIRPPSVEHRLAILEKKASILGLKISEEVMMYIATQAKRNIRELEGALHRIAAFSVLHASPITLELAASSFQDVLGTPQKRLTVETIQKTVADHYHLRTADLKSKKRQRALTIPRQVAMYLCRVRTDSSFPEIGSKFGGKDHTTVMHAVKKMEKDITSDLDLKTSIEALERKLDQLF